MDIHQVQDVEGVELCGTLKNVVALAAGIYAFAVPFSFLLYCFVSNLWIPSLFYSIADMIGFVDGLEMGNNTKVMTRR